MSSLLPIWFGCIFFLCRGDGGTAHILQTENSCQIFVKNTLFHFAGACEGTGERCWSFKEAVFERPECTSLRLFCLNAHPVALPRSLWSLFYLSLASMSGVCVCIHMCMSMYTHVYGVHSPVKTHVEARGWRQVSSSIVSLMFWDGVSHWTWSLLFRLVWLASSHRMYLFPPLRLQTCASPRVTSLCHHTQILLEC